MSLRALLEQARHQRTAVGAFTCYDLETAVGVLQAAEETASPVVLLVAERAFSSPAGPSLMRSLTALAEASPTAVLVQLDHVSELLTIEQGVDLGAAAVMADGSRLPLEDNKELCAAASRVASRAGAEVEVELGHIEGNEDVAHAIEAGAFTDPDEAVELVAGTGAACLAVSIGNVHGHYLEQPRLDWDLLSEIASRVDVPLSLHGASGLEPAVILEAIRRGISKINVNTELRHAYLQATARDLEASLGGANLIRLHAAQVQAVKTVARAKLELFRAVP